MSLKTHIDVMQARVTHQLTALKEQGQDVENFPCTLCEGRAFLMCTVNFSTLNSPSQRLQTREGKPITGIELMACPTCAGTGIDKDAVLRSMGVGIGRTESLKNKAVNHG